MTEKEPTKEQIQKFWEWCGFQYARNGSTELIADVEFYKSPVDGHLMTLQPVDLNNLFKYAVPKLTRCELWTNLDLDEETHNLVQGSFGALTSINHKFGNGESTDPALALFWAIWEVINGK